MLRQEDASMTSCMKLMLTDGNSPSTHADVKVFGLAGSSLRLQVHSR